MLESSLPYCDWRQEQCILPCLPKNLERSKGMRDGLSAYVAAYIPADRKIYKFNNGLVHLDNPVTSDPID